MWIPFVVFCFSSALGASSSDDSSSFAFAIVLIASCEAYAQSTYQLGPPERGGG